MADALILWGHALAALLFGAMGFASLRGTERGWPRVPFCAAALLTALWALGVAGIDARDIGTRLAEAARNLAWLWFAAALAQREGDRGRAVMALTVVTGGVVAAGAVLAAGLTTSLSPDALASVATVRLGLRVLAALGALVLLCHLAQNARRDGRWLALAIGGIWCIDLIAAVAVLTFDTVPVAIMAGRGFAMIGIGAMIAAAAQTRGEAEPSISRAASLRLLGLVAIALYLGATAWVAEVAATFAPGEARAIRTAIVLGASMALVTLISTPWLRAWGRVKLAKHLFPHRYDYRVEWQRFTTTLGIEAGGELLAGRLVRAMANLMDAPGGLLLARGSAGLSVLAGWNWSGGGRDIGSAGFDAALAGGRIVALDEERAQPRSEAPAWLLDDADAWAVVPLIHADALAGAIVLARPPVDRALDWEDLDLLRVAGRQAASYLAEDRAYAALAEAARFDEFNRRFAFVLHDIKNVASQLGLVARNAERHADNPEFRADMIETLRDGTSRLGTLLARLGGQEGTRAEPVQPVDVAALVRRLAAVRHVGGTVEIVAVPAMALAAPGRLEQALGHLVQNAVEASRGRSVRVAVHAGECVTVEVVDQGEGMSAAFIRDELFRPFASTKPGGFGIGAYEARQLILAMGGTLEVDSREGQGTRFRVVLPAARPLEAAA